MKTFCVCLLSAAVFSSVFAMAKPPKAKFARKVSSMDCGNLDDALKNMREIMRGASLNASHKTHVSEAEAAQILSALISAKLEAKDLSEHDRLALQDEHEGACSGM